MPTPIWKDKSIPENYRKMIPIFLIGGSVIVMISAIALILSVLLWPKLRITMGSIMMVGILIAIVGYLLVYKFKKSFELSS